MKHKLLKNVICAFFIICFTIFCCGHFSCTQKAFLYLLLKTQFKTIEFNGYKGNWSHISAESITLSNKNQTVCLKNLDLQWQPFKLLTKRCFSIQKLNLFLEINGQVSNEKKEICTADFSKILSQNASKFSFLNQLQLPLPLNIQHLNIVASGYINGFQLINTRLFVENLVPNSSSVCKYSTLIQMDKHPYFSHLQVQGSAQMLLNDDNKLQKIKLEGVVNAKNHQKKYPKCTYNFFVAGNDHSKSETLKCELHCGQANDFIIEGETFKTAAHALNLRWQGIFDHTFIHTFYSKPIPNLSILLDGTCNLNRKTNRWDIHSLLSIWGKHFEVIDSSLSNLPNLNFKTEVQAHFDTKEIQLKNYKISLKEKGAKKLFFSVRSDQTLTYNFKKGLQKPEDKNLQLLDFHIYEVPLAFFTPYLQTFNWGIEGQLQSGNLALTYTDQEKWQIAILQPLRVAIKKLTYKKIPVLSNTHFKLDGNLESNSEKTKINYESKLIGTDPTFTPFLNLELHGNLNQKNGEMQSIASNGNVKFNQNLAQGKLDLSAFGLTLRPDLILQASYDLKHEKQQWFIKHLKTSLQSYLSGNAWLYFNLNQPICLKSQNLLSGITNLQGTICTLQCDQCPLDLVSYRDTKLAGQLSINSHFTSEKNSFTWEHQSPLCVDNLQVVYQGQKLLDLKKISCNLKGSIDSKFHTHYALDNLKVEDATSNLPLISGNAEVYFKKDKFKESRGQVTSNLDGWFLQPFALKLPGIVGDLSTHWIWDEKEHSANAQCKISALNNDFSLNLQGAYQNEKEDQHTIQSNLEMRNGQHTSDLHIDGMLKKTVFDGKITSKQFFLMDILQIQKFLQTLNLSQVKSTQTIANQDAFQKQTPSDNSNKTVKEVHKTIPTKAPWDPYAGVVAINCKSICLDEEIIKNLTGQVEINPSGITLKDGRGFFFEGNTQFNLNYQLPSFINTHFKAQDMQLSKIWNTPKALGMNLNNYGSLHGNCNLDIDWFGNYTSLLDSKGTLQLKAFDGYFKPFSTASTTTQAVNGLTSTLGLLLGTSVSEMSTLGFINSYLKSVPFSFAQLDLERKNNDKIDVKGTVQNTDAAFYANGFVATETEKTWQQQPFKLNLQLDASKGPFLNYFAFDTTQKTNEGYYPGPKCEISGTLGKPNYMNLLQLLKPKQQPEKKASPRSSVQQLLRQFF